MKWLFLLLLTVNVAIFAWGYQQEQIQPPAVEAGGDLGNMRLISELQEDAKLESEAEADTKQEKSLEPQPKTEAVEKVASNDSAAEKTAAAEQAEKSEPQEPEPGTISKCGVIGPLKDRQMAKQIMEDLAKAEIEAKLKRWKEAVAQAVSYKKFSDKSIVAMAPDGIPKLKRSKKVFVQSGIGLISVNGGPPETVLPGKRTYNNSADREYIIGAALGKTGQTRWSAL